MSSMANKAKSKILIIFPILFLTGSLTADVLATWQGTGGDFALEGNIVAAWLWEKSGPLVFILPLLWLFLILAVGLGLIKKQKIGAGLWVIYSVALGHLIGFLSWTPLDFTLNYLSKVNDWLLLAGLLIIAGLLGLVFTKIHLSFWGQGDTMGR